MISVIMSVYNESENLIQEAVNSILNQTEKNFELIIVNDNPNNITNVELLKKIESRDSRIKVIYNDVNIGLAGSLNNAVSMSDYDIIARMDADDFSYSNRLEEELKTLDLGYDFVFSRYEIIDEFGIKKKESKYYTENEENLKKAISKKNIICHPTVMFRKSLFYEVGGYTLLPVVEDYDLWRKFLTKKDVKIKGLNDILIKYRVRSASMTTSNYFKSYIAWRYIQKKYRKKTFMTKNKDFITYYKNQAGNKCCNEKKYNESIVNYYSLRDSWNNFGFSKYPKLIKILANNYRICILLINSLIADYYRRK